MATGKKSRRPDVPGSKRPDPEPVVSRAERNIAWIERYCCVPEGKNVGKPLKLAEFMREDLRAIYDNPHGTRRAIFSRGRKNAKTTEAALIMLLHLCGPEHKVNSQLISAAQSRDQASLLFNMAAKIVRLNPLLKEVVTIRDTVRQLACPALGTLYRALSAEATTAYGLSPALAVHDELGQAKGPLLELYEAIETATAAQEEPLSVIISTQARTDADLLSVLIDDALAGADPRVVVRLSTAPLEDDPFAEETIRKANPAYDEFMNRTEVLGMAQDAKRMPSREGEYRNLILNQRVETEAAFIARSEWTKCGAAPKPFGRAPVFGGLDLSDSKDLTALILVAKIEGVWQVESTFWLPKEGLADKSRRDRVAYDLWSKQGHLQAAPGKSVDYEFVATWLRGVCDKYNMQKIAFDRWNFKHLKPWLLKANFTEADITQYFTEFGQGFQSMSPALRDLEGEIANARLAHGNHPVLTMCAGNAVVQRDPAGNRKLTKNRSTGRIDGMVALAMAMSTALSSEEKKPAYQMLIV